MKTKLTIASAIFTILIFSNLAFAVSSLPLNTGYDHWNNQAYTGLPNQDDYWINVSTATNFIPTYAINKYPSWANAFTGTNWINFQNSYASAPGTSTTAPRYYIYRKCFCLQRGFQDPYVKFGIRADDSVSVWLNTVTNQVIAPTGGNFSGNGIWVSHEKGFRTGSNCLYVLVEDRATATGFDLQGVVAASAGLLGIAKGPKQSYSPCSCNGTASALDTRATLPSVPQISLELDDDVETINQIREIAEKRLRVRQQ